MDPHPKPPGLDTTKFPGETGPPVSPSATPDVNPDTAGHPPGQPPKVLAPDHPFGSVPDPIPPLDLSLIEDTYPFLTPTNRSGELGRLGKYRIIKKVGEGGMGFVFLAEDEMLRRPVALKVMRPTMSAKEMARERFLREGRAAAAVNSDHVVTIYEVDETKGTIYLAMKYLEGHNLEEWLKARPGPVDATAVVWVAKDVLNGLIAVHEKGLIHRDIKPNNLWVEAGTERIKLLDFGITRGSSSNWTSNQPGGEGSQAVTAPEQVSHAGGGRTLTQTGEVLGTPAYMAPEQAQGHRVDARADLFSLGAVLYRMIAGQSPFQRQDVWPTLAAVVYEEPLPLASFAVVPPALASLIDWLLAKNPNDRPASAEAALAVVSSVKLTPDPWLPPPRGERNEKFEYLFDRELRQGTRRVLALDLGSALQMEFVRIPKGNFLMGAPSGEIGAQDNEKAQRRVTISRDFYLGKFAVTQAQYRAVTGKSTSNFTGDQLPVEQVSWEDAVKFCEAVSARTNRLIRLPTEAEWEYACRAGTTTPFHFGHTLNGDLANCDGNYPYRTEIKGAFRRTTVSVGSYLANPWGLHEMHGNVWEWCQDVYAPYPKGHDVDPVHLPKYPRYDFRILRGGSWVFPAVHCRAACRVRNAPSCRNINFGFRVVFQLD